MVETQAKTAEQKEKLAAEIYFELLETIPTRDVALVMRVTEAVLDFDYGLSKIGRRALLPYLIRITKELLQYENEKSPHSTIESITLTLKLLDGVPQDYWKGIQEELEKLQGGLLYLAEHEGIGKKEGMGQGKHPLEYAREHAQDFPKPLAPNFWERIRQLF